MNRILSLLYVLGTTALAQEQAPTLLLGAAHCISAKGFLLPMKATTLTLGYLDDTKSYPGDEVLYVVVYSGPLRSDGWVFSVILSSGKGSPHLSINNNAKFVRSYKKGVAFRKRRCGLCKRRRSVGRHLDAGTHCDGDPSNRTPA